MPSSSFSASSASRCCRRCQRLVIGFNLFVQCWTRRHQHQRLFVGVVVFVQQRPWKRRRNKWGRRNSNLNLSYIYTTRDWTCLKTCLVWCLFQQKWARWGHLMTLETLALGHPVSSFHRPKSDSFLNNMKSLYELYWPFIYIIYHLLFQTSYLKPTPLCQCNHHRFISKRKSVIMIWYFSCIDKLIWLWCYIYQIYLFHFIIILLNKIYTDFVAFMSKRVILLF